MMTLSSLAILSAVVSRASGYVVLIVLARLLSPEDFGAYAIAAIGVTVVAALVSGGGDMWLNRFTRQQGGYRRHRKVSSYYLAVSIATAGLLAAAGTLAAFVIAMWSGHFRLVVTATAFGIALGFAEALFAIVRSTGGVRMFFGLRDLVVPVAIVGLLVGLKPETAAAALVIQALAWAVAIAVTLVMVRLRGGRLPLPSLPPPRLRAALARHTINLMYGNLGSRLSAAVDVLLVSGFIGLAGVGEYRVAGQFAAGFMIVQHFIFLGLPWQMHRLGTPEAPGAGLEQVEQRQRLLLALAAVALGGLLLLAEPILALLGERFIEAAPLFRVFAVIRFSELLWGPQHEILVSNRRAAQDAHSNMFALAAWPATFFLLLPMLDPLPASLAAVAVASLARQAYRRRVLAGARLPLATGYPWVGRVALACSAGAVVLGLAA